MGHRCRLWASHGRDDSRVSEYFWPLEFRDRTLDITRVDRACHALSLDDERTTFHPLLWNESTLAPVEPGIDGVRRTRDEKISQVWFSGVHSNVGGGYPDDALAYVSLNWILAEAKACGLQFKSAPIADPDAIKQALAAQDKDGRLYNSRAGLGSYYRYGPRRLDELCSAEFTRASGNVVSIPVPKIHESAFDRIKLHAHFYAPVVLPRTYEMVTYDGRILALGKSEYETPARARFRTKLQERV